MWNIGPVATPRARRHHTSLIAAAVAAVAIAGCGGGTGTNTAGTSASTSAASTTGSTQTTTEGQPAAVTQANAICQRLNKQIESEGEIKATITEIERYVPRHIIAERQVVRELQALRPPARLAAVWRRLIGYRQTLAAELSQLERAAKANDTRAINALASSKKRVHSRLRTLAEKHELAACGQIG
jgi:hypothetical protein